MSGLPRLLCPVSYPRFLRLQAALLALSSVAGDAPCNADSAQGPTPRSPAFDIYPARWSPPLCHCLSLALAQSANKSFAPVAPGCLPQLWHQPSAHLSQLRFPSSSAHPPCNPPFSLTELSALQGGQGIDCQYPPTFDTTPQLDRSLVAATVTETCV